MRRAVAAAAILVVLPTAAGCGRSESYCDAVRDHQTELGTIVGGGDRTALLQALPIFEDLQDKAPDDVATDWDLLVTRIQALDDALQKAGVDPASYDPRHPPAGPDAADRRAIRRAAAQLAAADTRAALASVQQEVLDVCHTPLEM
jgi:hypothetical protein